MFILTILLFLAFTANSALAVVGHRFVMIPPDAHGTALGETGVSYNPGGTGIWWNPAHLCGRTDLWLEGWSWMGEGRGSFGGARVGSDKGGLGAYYINLGLPGFEARDRPGDSQGEFTLHQAVFATGAGWSVFPFLQTGAIVKAHIEDIYGKRYQSPAYFDFGIKSNYGPWETGLAVRNLTTRRHPDTPATIQAGLSREYAIGALNLRGIGEGSLEQGGDRHLHLGAECSWMQRLALRMGWSSGHDARGLTFGLGAAAGRYRVDWAWLPFRHELGDSWRMGIAVGI
ncbi:MAG: hypothetical protein V2A61_07155 [Calditrichota bacterium]